METIQKQCIHNLGVVRILLIDNSTEEGLEKKLKTEKLQALMQYFQKYES